jgi:hypothetical protein
MLWVGRLDKGLIMLFIDKALLIVCGACIVVWFGIWMGILYQDGVTQQMDRDCKTRFGEEWEVRRSSIDYCVNKTGDIKYI